jgi:hypothetical protein
MAIGAGICAQLGLAEESTVGTAVTVTRFYEVDSVEPTHEKVTKVSEGLRACGRGHRERNRVVTGKSVSAQVGMTAMSKGLGVFFKHALGTVSTAQLAASLTYRQIHLVGDLTGKGLTVQGGFPESYSGTVRPYTWNGCKVTEWQLSNQMDDLVKLSLTLDGWNWTNATALATASYLASLEAYHWGQMTATFGGTVSTGSGRTTISGGTTIKGLRGITLSGTNALRTDRRVAGGAGIKAEQLENGFREFTGELDMEFADRTQLVDLYDADTSTALQFAWTGVTNDGSGNFPVLRVTYPKVKFDTGAPSIGGPDVLDNNMSFTAYEEDAGTHPLIQVEVEGQDTAP